jgi:CRP-like cAMP-binding protein
MADKDLIARMGACKLFSDLSESELADVADRMREDHFPGKTQILKEGEEGMGFFFVVLDGGARVVQHGKEIAQLKAGDFFGEITSLNGGPRTASVTTNEPVWTLGLNDWDFRPFLEAFPKVTFRILEQVCLRYQAVATNAGG